MRRFLGLLLVAMMVALLGAFALGDDNLPTVNVGVKFDDSTFDYFVDTHDESGTEVGYIHLVRDLNTVTVQLNNVAEGGLQVKFDRIEDYSDERKEEGFEFQPADLRAKLGIDVGNWSVHLTFKDTELAEAETYFSAAMKGLSFQPSEIMQHTSNTLVFDCGCTSGADYHLRLVLSRFGPDVHVNISGL